jgi:chromosome segregation ATPase
MTDDELNQKFAHVENHIEALTVSLDRLEEAREQERIRYDETQARADARIARLERLVGLIVRAGNRERKALREDIRSLTAAQANTDRNLALMVEHFDRKVDALAAGQERLEQGQAEMQTAVVQLQQGQVEMQAAVVQLQQGQVEMQAAVVRLQQGQAEMQTAVVQLQQGQAEMQAAIVRMAEAVAKVAGRLDALEGDGGRPA